MNGFLHSRSSHAAAAFRLVAGVVICVSIPGNATAQPKAHPEPEPTVLERIAGLSATSVVSAETVGRIVSGDTSATVTAIILENAGYRPSRVRGVRIDLRDSTSTERIYIDEQDLVYHLHELNSLDCSVARMRDRPEPYHGIIGIARCRPSNTVPQAYCPGFRAASDLLTLSLFGGSSFRFASVRPSALAEAIDRALDKFGLDNQVPRPGSTPLPRAVLDGIFASAVRQLPQLASSAGIKAAAYQGREQTAAWAVFWPYERTGDMAHAYSARCRLTAKGWHCYSLVPRGYLSLADQNAEVVIMGPLDREAAVALVDFSKRVLRDVLEGAAIDHWRLISILPPGESVESFHLVWRNEADESIELVIDEAPPDAAARFELLQVWGHKRRPVCGGDSYATDRDGS